MNKKTLTFLASALLWLSAAVSASAQANGPAAGAAVVKASAEANSPEAVALARAAFEAQGGGKFRAVRNYVLVGTVDLYSPNSTQPFPAKFAAVYAGDQMRLEIQSSAFNLRQIDNGRARYSSIRGMQSPPARLGLSLLTRFDQPGYTVSLLSPSKGQKAFRITDAEGNATDFYVDAASGRVVRYEIPFGGARFSVENKELKQIEGALIPLSYAQKLDTPQGAFIADFKVKDVKINQELSAEMFSIPAQ